MSTSNQGLEYKMRRRKDPQMEQVEKGLALNSGERHLALNPRAANE